MDCYLFSLEVNVFLTFASLCVPCQLDKTRDNASFVENEVGATPGPETARRIDAGILNFKQIFLAMLILLIAVAAYYYSSQLES